jgi:tRNA 2-thiouridine synthesizing protein A
MAETLDARELKCPLPVLKARRAMKSVAPGELLTVLATDPGAPKDFEHFCATTGCELVENSERDGVFRIVLRKPADAA